MIHVERISVSGNIPFENVDILTEEEQEARGFINYFEDAQIVIKCKDGIFTLPTYKLSLIQLKRSKRKLSQSVADKVKRIALSGNLSFAPAQIVRPGKLEEAGIPQIFGTLDQFTFVCNEGTMITTDFNVTLIEH